MEFPFPYGRFNECSSCFNDFPVCVGEVATVTWAQIVLIMYPYFRFVLDLTIFRKLINWLVYVKGQDILPEQYDILREIIEVT